jgi:hypothetical protein
MSTVGQCLQIDGAAVSAERHTVLVVDINPRNAVAILLPKCWFYLDFLSDIEPGTWRWVVEQKGAEVMKRPFSVLSESPAATTELLQPIDKIASEALG